MGTYHMVKHLLLDRGVRWHFIPCNVLWLEMGTNHQFMPVSPSDEEVFGTSKPCLLWQVSTHRQCPKESGHGIQGTIVEWAPTGGGLLRSAEFLFVQRTDWRRSPNHSSCPFLVVTNAEHPFLEALKWRPSTNINGGDNAKISCWGQYCIPTTSS